MSQQINTPSDKESRSTSSNHQVKAGKYARYLEPGQQAQLLTGRDKVILSFAEQARPWAAMTPLLAAGWEHLLDTNPRYGVDKAGFGERLGAAFLRQASQAVLSDGFAAAIFREDPRYYRTGKGKIGSRIWRAASRVVVTRTDNGNPTMNYAQLFGYAGAAALTRTYYPERSTQWGAIWKGYGISLSSAALGKVIHEFGPDFMQLVRHKIR